MSIYLVGLSLGHAMYPFTRILARRIKSLRTAPDDPSLRWPEKEQMSKKTRVEPRFDLLIDTCVWLDVAKDY